MVFTNAQPFPYLIAPLTNITPFTYSDGVTYLSQLEQMREWLNTVLVPAFNDGITNAITEYQNGLGNAEAYVDEMVTYINNKTGQVEIQRHTLDANYTVQVDPQWPTNHPVTVVLTQNHIGAYTVTLGTGITGSVVVDPAPNSVSEFTLIPVGDGTWKVFQFTAIQKAIQDELDLLSGELDGTQADLTALTTRVTDAETAHTDLETVVGTKASQDDMVTALGSRVPVVRTFAELVEAVAAGGTVHVGDASITITAEIPVNVPVIVKGGHFILPENAGYPAFKVTTHNVTFDGCRFAGPGTAAAYDINSRFIYAVGTSSEYLRNINVRNCRMTGNQTENIRFQYVIDSDVSHNRMDDFLYAGVMLLSVEDSTISHNRITNAVMKAPVVNVYGIAATDNTNVEATRSRNITISGNNVRNIPWEGIDTHGGESIVITGNTVVGCARGIALVSGNETRLTVPLNCIVTGNYVDLGSASMTDREGIGLFGLLSNLASATITGNVVQGYEQGKAIYTGAFDHNKTLVEGNSHPHIDWTTVGTSGVFGSNSSNPWQYMVDGRNVIFRGMATDITPTEGDSLMGNLPSVARPNNLTFPKNLRGASTTATTVGTLGVYSNGEVKFLYRNNTTGSWSYAMDCVYQRRYSG